MGNNDGTIDNQKAGDPAANPTNNGGTPTDGADPKKTDPGADANAGVDTSKFSDADWDKIYSDPKLYNHPRFKGLNDQAKQAKILADEKKANEEAALVKNKEFEELAKRKETEAAEWKGKAENAAINNSIALEAGKLGVVDVEVVTKLIDKSGIKLGDDGIATGVAEAVKALVDAKPYLKGGKPNVNLGNGTNPSNADLTTPRFKLSQIQDFKFYQAHEKEIMEAQRLGLIENDTGAIVKS